MPNRTYAKEWLEKAYHDLSSANYKYLAKCQLIKRFYAFLKDLHFRGDDGLGQSPWRCHLGANSMKITA